MLVDIGRNDIFVVGKDSEICLRVLENHRLQSHTDYFQKVSGH
jgi:hypothetical protein